MSLTRYIYRIKHDENTGLIFARQIMSELLNNAALIPLHVDGLTSHASFFMQADTKTPRDSRWSLFHYSRWRPRWPPKC